MSAARSARTRVRGGFYLAAIDLAGAGLLWPILISVSAVIGLGIYLSRWWIVSTYAEYSIYVLLALTAAAAYGHFVLDDPIATGVGGYLLTYWPAGLLVLLWAIPLGGGLPEITSWVSLGAIAFGAFGLFARAVNSRPDAEAAVFGTFLGLPIGTVLFFFILVKADQMNSSGGVPDGDITGFFFAAPATSALIGGLSWIFLRTSD